MDGALAGDEWADDPILYREMYSILSLPLIARSSVFTLVTGSTSRQSVALCHLHSMVALAVITTGILTVSADSKTTKLWSLQFGPICALDFHQN